MTRILLFGGSGFIGAHVRDAFETDDRADRIACPGRSRLDLLAAGVDDMVQLLREEAPDVVVNCTGRLDGRAAELLVANTLVTATIIEAIAAVRPTTRFIRIGSAGEYGHMPVDRGVREDDSAVPLSAYGLTHHAATRLVEIARTVGSLDGVTLRVFNPIGPGLKEETVLGRACRRLREAVADGRSYIEMGPLDAYRDFVDARDVATAVMAAAFAPTLPVPVLNIGSGRTVPTREAVRLLAQVAGFTGEVREQGSTVARSAAVSFSLADIGQARAHLGWEPSRDLTDSVKAIWAAAEGG